MIKIKITTEKNLYYVFPVPYFLLNCCGTFLSSHVFWKQVKKWSKQDATASVWLPDSLDKKTFRELVSALKKHKGLTLVDANLKDSMKVRVQL
ncbi:MAG: hypothetical protein ACQEWV_21220 [Bacillota bacterium]